MIVDDEIIVASDLKIMLEEMGYRVIGVSSTGRDAIKKSKELKPDLVLMDIKLEGDMDGIEAAGIITSELYLPVIFITAHSDSNTLESAKKTDPYGYMIKPFDERDLKTTIEIALYKHAMEMELRESQAKLRNMSIRLNQIREEERIKIAREIHDGLGNALAMMKFDLFWLRKKISGKSSVIHEKIDSMVESVEKNIDLVKRVASELRPSVLEHLSLTEAIDWQAREFARRTGIECKIKIDSGNLDLDRDLSVALFRVFQEALTNVMKHSGASEVEVRLLIRDTGIRLVVSDNGTGISREKIGDIKSTGITGMKERVLSWGGSVQIKGDKKKGTVLTVDIPDGKTK